MSKQLFPRVHGLRVAVLDDESDVRKTVSEACRFLGAAAAPVATVEELNHLLTETGTDLAIVDLRLQGEDGLAALRSLGQRGFRGRVVVSTGLAPQLARAAVEFGSSVGLRMAPPLAKPVTLHRLSEALLSESVLPVAPAAGARQGEIPLDAFSVSNLCCHFQRQVSLATRETVACEALLRLWAADGSLIAPTAFVPVMERAGRLGEITTAVTEFAASFAATSRVPVAINIGAEDLQNSFFAQRMISRASRHGIDPSTLTLELTERTAIELESAGIETAVRLRLAGFGLSLDDFSMGHSSLLRLQQLPFTELKLDRALVRRVASDAVARSAVAATLGLAADLEIAVVAEGVETETEADLLTEMGCSRAQGYLFGRPVPRSKTADWAGLPIAATS